LTSNDPMDFSIKNDLKRLTPLDAMTMSHEAKSDTVFANF
jgi:hypothetical protein